MGVGWFLISTMLQNRAASGIAVGYDFLYGPANIRLSDDSLISYAPSDNWIRALEVGVLNTLVVSVLGIVLATILGTVIGVARLSGNWLVAKLAAVYVDVLRNIPLPIQLLLWIGLIRFAPPPREAITLLPDVFISNKGLRVPAIQNDPIFLWVGIAALIGLIAAWAIHRWAKARQAATGQPFPSVWTGLAVVLILPIAVWLAGGAPVVLELPQLGRFDFTGGWTRSPEFAAVLIGLSVYTAAFIAEIVRGGILAVSHGQTEAARSLGLHSGITLRKIILPQALRTILPPLTSQYLNLTKNSSLSVFVGYFDLVLVGNTMGNQTGRWVEAISIYMAIYLTISLAISIGMNAYNRRMALRER
ncbi:ABC transporter permease subunit [Inquilinus sp. Marseille-Q2685]|uniref:amino acid ABC transporter permease n=1 Tax=Inquilinus sp. Marseille-Q2685 TaxID=2866581 RepID=UPI0027E08823|nr:ABC transporter permease subunit [Inquilinus sp. Marseille-Q2685]